VLIKHLKQELVFHIYDYENLDNEMLYKEIISVILNKALTFFVLSPLLDCDPLFNVLVFENVYV
jgi:hypothetical protein